MVALVAEKRATTYWEQQALAAHQGWLLALALPEHLLLAHLRLAARLRLLDAVVVAEALQLLLKAAMAALVLSPAAVAEGVVQHAQAS